VQNRSDTSGLYDDLDNSIDDSNLNNLHSKE
jgi:hypothetical protein